MQIKQLQHLIKMAIKYNNNEYYELPTNKIAMVSHSDIVESKDSVKWSNDKTKFICKTKEGIKNGGALTPNTPMTHKQALALVNTLDYNSEV